ncbi:melanoma antigen preferentially expressed in tumors-like [Chionomys nivalis]|uniref:melanoma antigen preferentially expressed in tumors-like n=1 Tax=Chionomys nivalis TaxID=269649 RepID=UPI0025942A94|nr:melanoma antigen preferentially expressed in tumors-like [Chionomys nivalis]
MPAVLAARLSIIMRTGWGPQAAFEVLALWSAASEVLKKSENSPRSPTQFGPVGARQPSSREEAFLRPVRSRRRSRLVFSRQRSGPVHLRFTKMDANNPTTLMDLAIQCLLRHESAAIQALENIPRYFFIPLFIAAFKGGHMNILSEMVKVWPFYCLHLGTLTVREPHRELLKAMIENLPVYPAKNSASRKPKLRILDLRRDIACRITCPEVSIESPFCLHACTYSDQSVKKMEGQLRFTDLESIIRLPLGPVELLVDFSLRSSLMEKEFLVLLVRKIVESLGALNIYRRDLQVVKLGDRRHTRRFLDFNCVNWLSVNKGSLSHTTNIPSQMSHLKSLSLLKVPFRSLSRKVFKNFHNHLQRMENLKELNLSSFCLKTHLDSRRRVLPPNLDFLYLSFCNISYRDFRFLAQCPQVCQLKMLNLSNNAMYWDDFEPFQTLLLNLSGTLKHLEINYYLINDSAISILIPALISGTHLYILVFASNPITMPMLMNIMRSLTPLIKLKYVIYPIPIHFYERWDFLGSLDRRRLAILQVQLKAMLQVAGRRDMKWITYPE